MDDIRYIPSICTISSSPFCKPRLRFTVFPDFWKQFRCVTTKFAPLIWEIYAVLHIFRIITYNIVAWLQNIQIMIYIMYAILHVFYIFVYIIRLSLPFIVYYFLVLLYSTYKCFLSDQKYFCSNSLDDCFFKRSSLSQNIRSHLRWVLIISPVVSLYMFISISYR